MASDSLAQRSTGRFGNGRACLFFLMTAACFATPLPLTAWTGVHQGAPLLFSAVLRLGAGFMMALWIVVFHRRRLFSRAMRQELGRAVRQPLLVAGALFGYVGMGTLVYSTRYIDPALSFLLNELWPMIFLVSASFFLRGSGRYVRPGLFQWLLVVSCFAGVATCIVSQSDGLAFGQVLSADTLKGVGLASVGSLIVVFQLASSRWAALNGARLPVEGGSPAQWELLSLLIAAVAGVGCSGLMFLALGTAAGEWGWPGVGPALLVSLLVSVTFEASGQLGWRLGLGAAFSLGPVIIAQLSTPGAIVLMSLVGASQLRNPLWFAAGAAVVVASNMAISGRAGGGR